MDPSDNESALTKLIEEYCSISKQKIKEIINANKDDKSKWQQFMTQNIKKNDRVKFRKSLSQLIKLKQTANPKPPAFINQYNSLRPINFTLKDLFNFMGPQLRPSKNNYEEIVNEMKKNIKIQIQRSLNIQHFLKQEFPQIIDILKRRQCLYSYFSYFKQLCQLSNKPLAKDFKSMEFIDFILLLLKLVDNNDQFTYLLSEQNIPIPILFKKDNKQDPTLKSCRSFLKDDKYFMIANVGTNLSIQFKQKVTRKLFGLDERYRYQSIFKENVNLLFDKANNRVISNYYGQDTISFVPFTGQTSLLILYLKQKDLQGNFIQQLLPYFQSIEKLLVLVEDGGQAQSLLIQRKVNNQLLQIQVFNISSKGQIQSSILQDIKNAVNSKLKKKMFCIQQYFNSQIDEIDRLLNKYGARSYEELFQLKDKKYMPSFVEQSMQLIKRTSFSQFRLFCEKLQKRYHKEITINDIINSIGTVNEINIDKMAEVEASFEQNQLNRFYQKCINNCFTFNLLDTFLNKGFQRYLMGKFQYSRKKLYIVSVIGSKSSEKATLLNYLFGFNFYMNYKPEGGIQMGFCETDDSFIMILDGEISSDKFNRQVLVYLMKISNLVLFTPSSEDYELLIQQLKISYLILRKLQLHQNKKLKPLSKIVVALPHKINIQTAKNFTDILDDFVSVQSLKVFLIPLADASADNEGYSYFILSLRSYIINNLKLGFDMNKFVNVYKNVKVQWQIIQGISNDLFQANTQSSLQEKITSRRDYLKMYSQSFDIIKDYLFTQRIDRAKKDINQVFQTDPSILFVKSTSIIDKLRLLDVQQKDKIIQSLNKKIKPDEKQQKQLRSLYQIISLEYMVKVREYCAQKAIQYAQKKGFIKKTKEIIAKNLTSNNFQYLFSKEIDKIIQFINDQIMVFQNLKEQQQSLIKTFQTILHSYEVLKGGLQIRSINDCTSIFSRITKDQTNFVHQLWKFQNFQSNLQQRVQFSQIIIQFVGDLLQKYLKQVYSNKNYNSLLLLEDFTKILKKIDECSQNVKAKYPRNSLFQINYNKFMMAQVYINVKNRIAKDKEIQSQRIRVKASNIIIKVNQYQKMIIQFNSYYLKVKKLLSEEQQITNDIWRKKIQQRIKPKHNIVEKALKMSVFSELKKEKDEYIFVDPKSVVNCYKLVKNPQRFVNQTISLLSQQLTYAQMNKIILQIEGQMQDKIKLLTHHKPANQNNQDTQNIFKLLDQQIKKQIQHGKKQIIAKYKAEAQESTKKIIFQINQSSVCDKKCQECNSQCIKPRINSQDHIKHDFMHVLRCFGIADKERQVDLTLCSKVNNNAANQKKLKAVWQKIQDVIIERKQPMERTKAKMNQQYEAVRDKLTRDRLKELEIQDY